MSSILVPIKDFHDAGTVKDSFCLDFSIVICFEMFNSNGCG